MQIQWFPGHMHKARKEIKKILPQVDLIIEVLDARIPFSSENPMIKQLREGKPCIKLLNKFDLADPTLTYRWQAHFETEQGVKTLATCRDDSKSIRQISGLCRKMLPSYKNGLKPIHTLILGIPNVGKSTVINVLAGRSIAKTGNEPAVTKTQQRIKLDSGITLSDTPGVLWPNVENKNTGYRLASTGAIKDTAIDHTDVALFVINYLLSHYPNKLKERYFLDQLPKSAVDTLELIGKKRGCLGAGALVDFDKAAKIVLRELRSGTLGSFTMETPEIMLQELAELKVIQQQKAEKKNAREQRRKKKSH